VLICDNEEPLRALVRATIEPDGYVIVEARNGDEALQVARATRPDLIVLDMMMPGRTGLEVLAELRGDEALASTGFSRSRSARFSSPPWSPSCSRAAPDEGGCGSCGGSRGSVARCRARSFVLS
jgi:hypothetical protein